MSLSEREFHILSQVDSGGKIVCGDCDDVISFPFSVDVEEEKSINVRCAYCNSTQFEANEDKVQHYLDRKSIPPLIDAIEERLNNVMKDEEVEEIQEYLNQIRNKALGGTDKTIDK